MIEDFLIFNHCLRIEDRVDWRVDFVLKHEDIPPDFAMGILKHSGIEPAQDIWRVILGIRSPNRRLESCSQVVSVQRVCWTG